MKIIQRTKIILFHHIYFEFYVWKLNVKNKTRNISVKMLVLHTHIKKAIIRNYIKQNKFHMASNQKYALKTKTTKIIYNNKAFMP